MSPEYTLTEAVEFAMLNEGDTLAEQGVKVDSSISTAQLALDNAAFYADQYGYSIEDFKRELRKRGAR